MKIAIATDEENKKIVTVKEYSPIFSKGEVAHYIAELESIRSDLLEVWESEEVQEMKE